MRFVKQDLCLNKEIMKSREGADLAAVSIPCVGRRPGPVPFGQGMVHRKQSVIVEHVPQGGQTTTTPNVPAHVAGNWLLELGCGMARCGASPGANNRLPAVGRLSFRGRLTKAEGEVAG